VNPYDVTAVAEALQTALWMPLPERRERYEAMMKVVRGNDIHALERAVHRGPAGAGHRSASGAGCGRDARQAGGRRRGAQCQRSSKASRAGTRFLNLR